MKPALALATLCLALLGCSAARAQGALTDPQVAGLMHRIAPAKEELGWAQLPWRLTMREGVLDANAEDKPILVWHMRGHPLGATTLPAVVDRRWLFSSATLRDLLAGRFIPVAEDCVSWQRAMHDVPVLRPFVVSSGLADEPAVRRAWGAKGLTGSRIGLFCLAPNGKPLAAVNDPTRPEEVLRVVESALELYGKLRLDERLLPGVNSVRADRSWRWDQLVSRSDVPARLLVLRGYAKDLAWVPPGHEASTPYSEKARGFYTKRAFRTSWNMDHVWLAEPGLLVPRAPIVGQVHPVPARVARHLARLHLIDFVAGRGEPFADSDVKKAELSVRVVAVTSASVELRLEGATRCEAKGVWQPCELLAPSYQERGVDLELHGRIRFNRAAGSFEQFDLLAVGTRWGAAAANRRLDVEHEPHTENRAPAPIGFAFRLFAGKANDAVPPAMLWRLGKAYFGEGR